MGKQSVLSVSRELGVSTTAIYKWLNKYSVTYRKQTRMIVEKKSHKNRIENLESRIKELEAALGRKQCKIDYLDKLIDITEDAEGISIRKKDEPRRLNGSGQTEGSTNGE